MREHCDEMWNPAAAGLFVIRKGEMNGSTEIAGDKFRKSSKGAGKEPLHICGAATVTPVTFGPQRKGVGAPFRLTRWHHIHMAGQDIARLVARTDSGKQVASVPLWA